MNLISCCKDCEYQLDGYCDLNEMRVQYAQKVDGCCYYKKKQNLDNAQTDATSMSENCSKSHLMF